MPHEKSLSRRRKRFTIWLMAISLLALALRLAVCFELNRHPSVATPNSATDMATYQAIARDILQGRLPEAFYYQPFYYAVFLPLVYALFGDGPWGVIIVQSLLGAACVWLTGLMGARIFGRRAGLLGAALLALAQFHIFYTPFLLIAVLQSFWIVLLTYLSVRALDSRQPGRWWLAAAVVAAFGTLTRGNILLLLPGILLVLGWQHRQTPRRGLALAAAFIAIFYLPQLPFALHNLNHYQRWTGPSSAQDAVLALSNTPEAPPGGLEYPPVYNAWMEAASRPGDQRVPVSRNVLKWVKQAPAAFLELKLRTALLFWHGMEIPNNVAMANEGRASKLIHLPFLPRFTLISCLGLAGMLLAARRVCRSKKTFLLEITVLSYCAATVAFYILARFRLPVVPLLCVFGGFSLEACLKLRRAAKRPEQLRRQAAILIAYLAAGLFLAWKAFPTYQLLFEKPAMRLVRPDGVQVQLNDSWLVYDHGPATLGGWYPQEIPPPGLALKKRLVLPEPLAGAATLRIPFASPQGGKLDIRWRLQDGARGQEAIQLQPGHRPQWAELKIGPLPTDQQDLEILLQIQPRPGNLGLYFDFQRDYRRTDALIDGSWQTLDAEACLELKVAL